MKTIKEHKKDIILFIILFLISLIMCGAFLQPHYTHDTYKIIYDGYEFYSYDKFLKESRPLTAVLTLLAEKINLPIETYILLSFILALIFLSLSVLLVYKIFRKEYKSTSKWIDFLVLIIAYITIYNYLAIEHIYFLECGVHALAILLSVVAAKVVTNQETYKYAKAFIIIIMAVFCYQGSIAIFPMIVFTYQLLFQKNSIKENLLDIIKVILIYGIAMLCTILFAELIMGGSRITMNPNQFRVTDIFYWVKQLVIDSLGIIPPYLNLGIVVLTLLIIFLSKRTKGKEKALYIVKYLLVILASITICMAPILVGAGIDLTPRMSISFGSTIGLSLFTMLFMIEGSDKKYPLVFLSTIAIILFLFNISLYMIITIQSVKVNEIERENCEKIKEVIEAYEKETNIKVTKIVGCHRENDDYYYPGFLHAGAITQKGLNSWAVRETICFYIERHLQYAPPMTDEQYQEFFAGKTWDEFSTEQVVIEGDTLYFCGD